MNMNMNNIINLIKESSILESFDYEIVKNLLDKGDFRIVNYNKEDVIHFSTEKCEKLEVILSGKVAIEHIDEEGNLVTITEFFSDEILGGSLLFSKKPYFPMTITSKNNTTLLEIKKDVAFYLFISNPLFLRKYLEFIADHTTILGTRIKEYFNKTIREKIIDYLEKERSTQKSKIIYLKTSKKGLAEQFGVQRTSLSRELSKMKTDGLIDYDKNKITILY